MNDRWGTLVVLLVGIALSVACGRVGFEPVDSPCQGVSCGGHGICVEEGDRARCVCAEGYRNDGPLACVPDPDSGKCGTDTDCDDGSECTDDICEAAGDCRHDFNRDPCDDGMYCTVFDACSGGECVGPDRDCGDSDICTVDSCDLDPVYAAPYDCRGYRLPTEAEWEYAARAGTAESTYNGDIDASHLMCEEGNTVLGSIAWFCGNSGRWSHEAMTRDPNGWVLYDMLGNALEWCHDWYGSYSGDETDPWGPLKGLGRVGRGGSWGDFARHCRAADRSYCSPAFRSMGIGLRVARSN